MTRRLIKATVGTLGVVAFSVFGAASASASDYPPQPPEVLPPAPTPDPTDSETPVPVAAGTLPSTGGNADEILQIGLAALLTGGTLVAVSTRRRSSGRPA